MGVSETRESRSLRSHGSLGVSNHELELCRYEDMMDEVLEELMGEGVDDMDKEAAPDLGDGRPSVIYFKQAEKKTMLPLLS